MDTTSFLPGPTDPSVQVSTKAGALHLIEVLGLTDAKLFGVLITILGWLSSKRIRAKGRRWLSAFYRKLKQMFHSSHGQPPNQSAGAAGDSAAG